jgi:two-component system, NarL family, nitrate/nitrite response regulator NarL
MRVRVLLVDDHAVFRDAAAHVLSHEPDMEVIGTCDTVEHALESLASATPDLVLLDYDLRGRRGTEFIRAARERSYAGKVLIVSAGLPDSELQSCFYDGVNGVFLKENPMPVLLRAIRAVAEGRTWYDQRQMQVILNAPAKGQGITFTERERDVLRGIVDGLSNKQIAARLDIPETSVKAGVQRLFQKVGIRSRGGLVRLAMEKYRDVIG